MTQKLDGWMDGVLQYVTQRNIYHNVWRLLWTA